MDNKLVYIYLKSGLKYVGYFSKIDDDNIELLEPLESYDISLDGGLIYALKTLMPFKIIDKIQIKNDDIFFIEYILEEDFVKYYESQILKEKQTNEDDEYDFSNRIESSTIH